MLRSLALSSALTVALALPAAAQQLTEQDARTIAEKIEQVVDTSLAKGDVAAIGALFADDVIRVTPQGVARGRAEVEGFFTNVIAGKAYEAEPTKVDAVKVLGNDMIVVAGSWSGIWHSPNGPVHLAGRFGNTDVRVGDTWKITFDVVNDAAAK